MWFQLKKNGKEPKAGVEVTLKNVSYKTKVVTFSLSKLYRANTVESCKSFLWFFSKVCERSTSPRWDEAFHFLVRDPRDETLTVKVREHANESWLYLLLI